jgi:hypothetical protein
MKGFIFVNIKYNKFYQQRDDERIADQQA